MDRRRKHIDPEAERALRTKFFDQVREGKISIADAVKTMRKISRLTQEEFAEHRGISLKVLKKIESGEGNTTVETLNKIGEIFGVEVSFRLRRT